MGLLRRRTESFDIEDYPKGTFLKTEEGFFYVISKDKRYRFTTKRVLKSWNPQRVVSTSESNPAVEKLKVYAKMKFRAGSLLYCLANGNLYLVSENKVRHITNPDILKSLNMKFKDAVWVSKKELELHEIGPELDV